MAPHWAIERPGRAEAPITVRAPRIGLATLEFALTEGFHVRAPHWVFENLVIEGVCASHDDCEHAFHVVGAASGTVIRNNELREFNAHIKINGDRGRYPDGGQVAQNRIFNTAPRRTENPVTPIDLVAASDWTIRGNLVADFVKDGSDRTSYGVFAKGGGSGNRIEGNVVLCEHRLRGAPGRRVGLSFGGGGSGAASCRGGRCTHEHDLGMMRDNLIASCSDAGVYLNRSINSRLEHNTLIDTAGVQTRSAGELLFMANLVDGPLRLDAETFLTARDSRSSALPAAVPRASCRAPAVCRRRGVGLALGRHGAGAERSSPARQAICAARLPDSGCHRRLRGHRPVSTGRSSHAR